MNAEAANAMPNKFWLRLIVVVLIATGVIFTIFGIELETLGGTAYYAIAGLVSLVCGWLLWHLRSSGMWLYLLLFLGTVIWAVWEAGLNGWALLPRLGVVVVIGIALLAAWRSSLRVVFISIVGAGVLLVLAIAWPNLESGAITTNSVSETDSPSQTSVSAEDYDWPVIGRTAGADRYSSLQQITPENVSKLEVTWTASLGAPPKGMYGAVEATPIKIDDTLYTCGMMNRVFALDAETGGQRWKFDPKNDPRTVMMDVCRGVAYYKVPEQTGPCSERIIAFARGGRMFALDAHSGKRCPGFGNNGMVDLNEGMGEVLPGYYYHTSQPIVVRGNIVVGGSVLDGQEVGEPSGVIRGFDAVTGKFAWAWDMGRPGEHGMPPEGEVFTRGTPNAWAPISADEKAGLVYIPLGNATPDYLTSHRTPEMNKYTSSVVALDAETGVERWYFQTTHNDVWDYDIASPPSLVDIQTPDGIKHALIQGTKRGIFFVLNRYTGEPLGDVEERPVPQGGLPDQELSPTQPYPVNMPTLEEPIDGTKMWGVTAFDHLWCRLKFHESHYEGDFTPVIDKPTIVSPGYYGGSNWFGVSVDPERQLLVVTVIHAAMRNEQIPREKAEELDVRPYRVELDNMKMDYWPQAGTSYATKTSLFRSPIGVPCTEPPFGEIAAFDLRTYKTLWRQPLGTVRDTGPLGIPSMLPIRMGVPLLGGTLLTRTGLVFVGATQERTFRAFDISTGKQLWQDRLPAAGHANPMTYYSEESGRQMIVIPASGHPGMQNVTGIYGLVAYALPK